MALTRTASRPLIAVLTLISIALGGCGFHLRGATAVPAALEPIFVECAGNTPQALCDQVSELLELNDVMLSETATPDSYRLRLSRLQQTQRATAITETASAAEYDLRLQTTLTLLAPGQVPLLANAEITASEIFRYDEANVLAKRREQQELTEQLYQRLAQQIVFRLTPFSAERIEELRQEHRSQQPEAAPQVPGD